MKDFVIAAVGVIKNKEKVLLGKKAGPSQINIGGEWHFPGGRLKADENIVQCLKREMKEETGLEILPIKIIDVLYNKFDWGDSFAVWYECVPKNKRKKSKASSDLSEVKWVEKSESLSLLGKNFKKLVPRGVIDYLRGKAMIDYLVKE